jgi:hypothetical protein
LASEAGNRIGRKEKTKWLSLVLFSIKRNEVEA